MIFALCLTYTKTHHKKLESLERTNRIFELVSVEKVASRLTGISWLSYIVNKVFFLLFFFAFAWSDSAELFVTMIHFYT